MSFSSRMRERREELGLRQSDVAKALGVTPGAIANYENAVSSPKADVLYRVFDALQCDANFLFQDEMNLQREVFTPAEVSSLRKYRCLDAHGQEAVDTILKLEYDRISDRVTPIFETKKLVCWDVPVSAGSGIMFEKSDCRDLVVVANRYTRRADSVLKVSGNSMVPRFADGDLILVQNTDSVEVGEIGIFYYDCQSYVKCLGKDRLISLNPYAQDIPFDRPSEVRCQGRVLGILDPDWIV